MKLSAALEGYWLDKRLEFSENTIRNYSYVFRYLVDFLGDAELENITSIDYPAGGAFELYCSDQTGLRLQAPFVADSSKPNYEAEIQRFVTAVCNRWKGKRADWLDGGIVGATPVADQGDTPAETDTGGIPQNVFAELTRLLGIGGVDAVTTYSVRNIYENLTGKQLDGTRAKRWRETFLGIMVSGQTAVATD